MWPSEHWASKLYDVVSLGLIAGFVIGVLSTVLVVWMGTVKESCLKIALAATNQRANKLNKEFEAEKGTVAMLQEAASKQQERAARAERDLLEFKKEVAPCRFSGEQKAIFAKLLRNTPDPIAIVSSLFDGESSDFADDFTSAFKDAGQTFRITNRTTLDRGVEIGVVKGTPTTLVKRIASALTAIGLPYREVEFSADDHTTSPGFQANVMYLVTGHKPEHLPAPNE